MLSIGSPFPQIRSLLTQGEGPGVAWKKFGSGEAKAEEHVSASPATKIRSPKRPEVVTHPRKDGARYNINLGCSTCLEKEQRATGWTQGTTGARQPSTTPPGWGRPPQLRRGGIGSRPSETICLPPEYVLQTLRSFNLLMGSSYGS